jgi:CheY-specific phosphatase CheX
MMASPFPLEPYREGIAQVAESVFDTLLHLALCPSADPWEAPKHTFTGAVYYAGTWKGALLVECACEQAMDWAARFMSLVPPISLDDARDGLGELTNVMAGNLKPLLPPGVGISLPSVVQGSDYSLRLCGGNLSEKLCFRDRLGLFRITLVEVIGR